MSNEKVKILATKLADSMYGFTRIEAVCNAITCVDLLIKHSAVSHGSGCTWESVKEELEEIKRELTV